MNIETINFWASVITLLVSAAVKIALIAAAIWMLTNGWNGCAITAIIASVFTGWSYKDQKKAKGEK